MPKGTVKFFNTSKGYGFIAPDEGGGDVFVHVSELERSGMHSRNEGDKVTFETKMDPKRASRTRSTSSRPETGRRDRSQDDCLSRGADAAPRPRRGRTSRFFAANTTEPTDGLIHSRRLGSERGEPRAYRRRATIP